MSILSHFILADTSVPLRRTLSSPANAAAVGGEKVPALRPNFSSSVSEPSASSLSSPSSSQASGPYSGSAASLTASSSISTAKDSADCGEKNRSVQTLLLLKDWL